jgi:GntR family transcriptional regulator / MocR family aminotransferase
MPRTNAPAVSVFLRVDARADTSLQRQIYDGLRGAILAGTLTAGVRLPSSRALADTLGVSRTTVVGALGQLIAEGYVTTTRASGTFVTTHLPAAHRARATPANPPRLSARATALLAAPAGGRRLPGAPRPFRLGTPAVDLFPVALWGRLAGRRIRRVTADMLDYGDPAGFRPLRESIAAHVSMSRGVRCQADHVIVVAGAQDALQCIAQLLINPGDRVWLENPGYLGARAALTAASATAIPVPIDAEGLDVDAGIRAAPDAKLVYVTPSHQYPLGVTMSLARRLALLRWAARTSAWIVEDDYDSEYRYTGRPVPALHGLDTQGRVIYVGTFSKTLFPALRLGFLVVPDALIDAARAMRGVIDQFLPAIDQAVLADFIGAGHFARHIRRMRVAYSERRDALTHAAGRYAGEHLRLLPTDGGLHVTGLLRRGANDIRVVTAALERGVEATPLSVYYLPSGRGPRPGLVLGFAAVDPVRIGAGMRRLAETLRETLP